jgi:L-rhamnose isomerase
MSPPPEKRAKSAPNKNRFLSGGPKHIPSKRSPASYQTAQDAFASLGVDTETALRALAAIPISLHCWQGDDVAGFEPSQTALAGGIAVTGNHPGRARSLDELRADLDKAFSLIPGTHRLNLHASYGDFENKSVDRDTIEPKHFDSWIQWAGNRLHGIDFNPTLFAHPLASEGFTLSHQDKSIRAFWIEHVRQSRRIAAHFAKKLGTPTLNNIWIPDGYKDTPVDRVSPRERLRESLDEALRDPFPKVRDCVEPKLFGIGSESFTVGSLEFYLAYAISRRTLLCLDAGHFHPTESVADKISSVLAFLPEILLHVSRGVRWDSDHVVTLNDDLLAIAREALFAGRGERVHLGLDYFDASINRVAAWVIGTRNLQKALLIALLEPSASLVEVETARDHTARLALQEEIKALPWGPVWDEFCRRNDTPVGLDWIQEIRRYERQTLSLRH